MASFLGTIPVFSLCEANCASSSCVPKILENLMNRYQ